MIDLELYKIFKIVANEENITKASQRLNISQPAVTKHIKNLESQLNIKLFERTNRGLKLTDIGKKIYNEINTPIEILEKVENKYGNVKCINLGTHITVFNKILGEKFAKYCKEHPDIKINIDRSDLSEQFEKLEKQKLDIIISKKDKDYINDSIKFIKITEVHDILITNSKYNNYKEKLTIDDLKNKTIYMPRKSSITTKNFFESIKGLSTNNIKTNNINYRTILEMLKYDSNIALVTKEIIEEELDSKIYSQLNTTFKINPLEYGIYVNINNKFKELNRFVKELKETSNN